MFTEREREKEKRPLKISYEVETDKSLIHISQKET
jgi:hypothetical protein